jgi:hypothetical protein
MTKRDFYNAFLKIEEIKRNPDYVAFCEHEIELLEKKNAADKKPTAQQKENDGIKDAVFNGMADNRMYTITELIKEIPECADLTNQRVSALVRQLVAEDKVERFEEKRKAYFRKVKGV